MILLIAVVLALSLETSGGYWIAALIFCHWLVED